EIGSTSQPGSRSRLRVQKTEAPQPEVASAVIDEPQWCPKHPDQAPTDKCFICSKPICPRCMQVFGYACSPLCRAKADSHGIKIPVYAGQQTVIDARLWRKTVRVATAICLVAVAVLGIWFWYEWFGSM